MGFLNGLRGAAAGASASRRKREAAAGTAADPDALYCTACGHVFAKATTITPGSIWIELILWLAFLVPGLIYSIWRHNKRHAGCPLCESGAVIPAKSPRAQAELRQRST